MEAYHLLRREIRQYIFESGWSSLRKIQEAAIQQVHLCEENLILAAPTASGKTEAAFLPAINAIDNWDKGIKIVYISPLIALINDQFLRINGLCEAMNISVTAWHSEASSSQKKKLNKEPKGILLITPESIEAMLALRPYEAQALFKDTEWVIIDEIHSFLDNNRGLQLKSLLERLQYYMNYPVRYIGMSATLNRNDYETAKYFFNNKRETKILLDKSKNNLEVTKSYFQDSNNGISLDALNHIYEYSQKEAMLIFPNARRQVENIAVGLNKLGKQNQSNVRYFAHHASISKDVRQDAERFAKKSDGQLFSIVCTSTLELGIDIGSVDSIVQYNAPYSVSSLAQRLGRSGRQTGTSILHFIATQPWSLLQGLAAISLYRQNKLEPVEKIEKPYDVLAHQVLSILLENNGVPLNRLKMLHREFSIGSNIENEEYYNILEHLVENNFIEIIEKEAIAGVETEKLLQKGYFFTHFINDNNYRVYYLGNKIGEIPTQPNMSIGNNILLAGTVWTIKVIHDKNKKIIVNKAVTGTAPKFNGSGVYVSNEIREKMYEILADEGSWPKEPKIVEALELIREESVNENYFKWIYGEQLGIRTFKGTKINLTILILLKIKAPHTRFSLDDESSTIYGQNIDSHIFDIAENSYNAKDLEIYFKNNVKELDAFLTSYKYSKLLPNDLKIKYVINNLLDLEGTHNYLRQMNN